MQTAITSMLEIELPIFAFSHCRDVVAAVSEAGGFGVLGASGFSVDELEIELAWIDAHTSGRPYGIDIAFPTLAGGLQDARDHKLLESMFPAEHRAFVAYLADRYGLEPLPPDAPRESSMPRSSFGTYDDALDVIFTHTTVSVLATALGMPPESMVSRARTRGVHVAALCGKREHAAKNKAAGADIIVAQGYEAAGHTGEITTMVLAPQIVDEVRPTPVLAAGGIASGRQIAAALALGAAGAWCGSVWLATSEAETSQALQRKILAASSADTVRSTSLSGKPVRMLRSAWTDEWGRADSPDPLPTPLQRALIDDTIHRIERGARRGGAGAEQLLTGAAGQVIGQLTKIRPVRQVMTELTEELAEAVHAIAGLANGGPG